MKKMGIGYSPQNHRDVLNEKCLHCHSYLGQSDEELISQNLIVPNKPEKSLVYRYLKGSNVGGKENMPPKASLSNKEVLLIKNWIKSISPQTEIASKPSQFQISKTLSEGEIYKRCYSKLTDLPLSAQDDRLKEIEEGDLSGADACMLLIGNATKINDSDIIVQNELGSRILLNFQKLHSFWFKEWNFFTAMSTWGTFELLDPTRTGIHFSYSLFNPQYSLADIFSGQRSFELTRQSKQKSEFLIYKFKNEPRYKINDYKYIYGLSQKDGSYKSWNPSRVQTGKITGIKMIAKNEDILPIVVDSKDNQKEINPATEIKFKKSIHTGHGGGIIGDEAYISLNLGQDLGKKMDGGKLLPRRWSNALVSEFLCRDLPVLKTEDVIQYVQPNSTLPFRKNESCMKCHVTMDNMAGLVRNVQQTYSADAGGDGWIHSTHLRRFEIDDKLEFLKTAPDKDEYFYKRPYRALFKYRDVNDKLIVKNLSSLDELGKTILEIDDFYYCTSKKYLKYFTGVDIPLTLISKRKKNAKERLQVEVLKKLGLGFKKSKSLRSLIRSIYETPYFKSLNYEEGIVLK
ncbi:MAG: hypothetical protein GY909_06490 [Oligoflexia bacterium]|nr:hypothetical protein [Oligoflexia bacterium]